MMIVPAFALGVFVWLVYHAVRDIHPVPVSSLSPVDGAVEVARRRLATGEITIDEYWKITRVLRA